MAQKKSKEEGVGCPVGKFFKDMDDVWGRKSKFFNFRWTNDLHVWLSFK